MDNFFISPKFNMYFSLKHWSMETAQRKIGILKKLLKKKGYTKLKREYVNGCFHSFYILHADQPEQTEGESFVSVITGGKAPENSITPENYERFIEYLNTAEVPALTDNSLNLQYVN